MSKDLKRRQSFIPKPQFNSRNSSPLPSPNSSPTKSSPRRIFLHPPSPSKLPVINLKKRPSNQSDYDIDELFKHSQNDLEMQRQELSGLSFNIDTLLATKYQLESEIRDFQRKIERAANKIQEYEIGIPYNESILKEKTNIIEDEIAKLQDKIELRKLSLIKEFKDRQIQFELSLQELVDEADKDDEETIASQTKRLNSLEEQKCQLLSQIDTFKSNIDNELEKFQKELEIKVGKNKEKLCEQRKLLENELNDVTNNIKDLRKKYKYLSSQETEYSNRIKDLEFQLESKSKEVEELQFKLNDIKTLIESLEHDFDAASKLRADFEKGEYLESKNAWNVAREKLKLEKYKRLKTELQIKELSGIPNIIILENDKIKSFNNSKLSEFIKASNYDYQSELFTALESSLSGISTLVLFCNDHEVDIVDEIHKLETNLLEVASNQERFNSFDTQINCLNITEMKTFLTDRFDLPDLQGIHVKMNNKDSGTSREAVIIIALLNSSEKVLNYLPLYSQLQTFTIALDISDTWYEPLSQLISIKPVRIRQAFTFLNDSSKEAFNFSTNFYSMNEDRHQAKNRQSSKNETDFVTLTRAEFENLKASERKLLKWRKFKVAIISIIVVIFVIALIKSINSTTFENQINNIKFDAYYENEFERARKQASNSKKRPGRIYHRGGSYGRN